MEKINNKKCNVDSFDYDESMKKLKIQYKISGLKEYEDVSKEYVQKIKEKNSKNKTVGKTVRKIVKNKKVK